MGGEKLPEGCKDAQLNLMDAYRTTATRIVVGDEIRVHYGSSVADEEVAREVGRRVLLSGTKSPSRSFWARVESINPVNRSMTLAEGHQTMPLVAHEGITRRARDGEPRATVAVPVKAKKTARRGQSGIDSLRELLTLDSAGVAYCACRADGHVHGNAACAEAGVSVPGAERLCTECTVPETSVETFEETLDSLITDRGTCPGCGADGDIHAAECLTAGPATVPAQKRAHAAHDAYLASIVITSNCHTCGPRDQMGCGHCYPADATGLVIVDPRLIAEWWATRYVAAVVPSPEFRHRTIEAIEEAWPEPHAAEVLSRMAATPGLSVRDAATALVAEMYPLVCQEQTHTPCEYRTDTVAAMRYHVQRAHGDDTSALWLDSLTDAVTEPPAWVEAPDLAPWEKELLSMLPKITEAAAPAGSRHGDHIRDYAIGYVPQYRGHWSGVAWVSHHVYGLQMHMTLADARNWVSGRVEIYGKSDLVAAPIRPTVLTRRKGSKGRGNRGW